MEPSARGCHVPGPQAVRSLCYGPFGMVVAQQLVYTSSSTGRGGGWLALPGGHGGVPHWMVGGRGVGSDTGQWRGAGGRGPALASGRGAGAGTGWPGVGGRGRVPALGRWAQTMCHFNPGLEECAVVPEPHRPRDLISDKTQAPESKPGGSVACDSGRTQGIVQGGGMQIISGLAVFKPGPQVVRNSSSKTGGAFLVLPSPGS